MPNNMHSEQLILNRVLDETNDALQVTTVGGSTGVTDDTAFTVGSTNVTPAGFLADETATDSVDEGDTGAARMTLDRRQLTASETTDDAAIETGTRVAMIGGKYDDTSIDTLDEDDAGYVRVSQRRALKTDLDTKLAGEDQTNDVMKTEQQFTGQMCTADTQVKAAAGFIHSVTFQCSDATPTAGSIIIYDNTAESGTQIVNFQVQATYFTPFTLMLNRICTTGIYVGFTTTNDVAVQVTYR